MNYLYSLFAFENNFGVGFNINKTSRLYEWYIACHTCNTQESLPKYTESAYELGTYPWQKGKNREESEIWAFFDAHKHIDE